MSDEFRELFMHYAGSHGRGIMKKKDLLNHLSFSGPMTPPGTSSLASPTGGSPRMSARRKSLIMTKTMLARQAAQMDGFSQAEDEHEDSMNMGYSRQYSLAMSGGDDTQRIYFTAFRQLCRDLGVWPERYTSLSLHRVFAAAHRGDDILFLCFFSFVVFLSISLFFRCVNSLTATFRLLHGRQ